MRVWRRTRQRTALRSGRLYAHGGAGSACRAGEVTADANKDVDAKTRVEAMCELAGIAMRGQPGSQRQVDGAGSCGMLTILNRDGGWFEEEGCVSCEGLVLDAAELMRMEVAAETGDGVEGGRRVRACRRVLLSRCCVARLVCAAVRRATSQSMRFGSTRQKRALQTDPAQPPTRRLASECVIVALVARKGLCNVQDESVTFLEKLASGSAASADHGQEMGAIGSGTGSTDKSEVRLTAALKRSKCETNIAARATAGLSVFARHACMCACDI